MTKQNNHQNILALIAERTKERIEAEKRRIPLEQVRRMALMRRAEELTEMRRRPRAEDQAVSPGGSKEGPPDDDLETPPGGYRETPPGGYRETPSGGYRETPSGGYRETPPGSYRPASPTSPGRGHFYQALASPGMSFICEVKKASPSKGVIAGDFPYLSIAREYEAAGASAISCLTEPCWFLGSDRYLEEITAAVSIPVLRKDFTVDEYMIYQAKALGASAILLICAILDDGRLSAYGQLAASLGLDVLTEAHTEEEINRAVRAGASILGVNNRDLKTFQVDVENSRRLRSLVPPDILFVSESGIKDAADIRALSENGTDAVLIGETLMRADDKKAKLDELKGLIP